MRPGFPRDKGFQRLVSIPPAPHIHRRGGIFLSNQTFRPARRWGSRPSVPVRRRWLWWTWPLAAAVGLWATAEWKLRPAIAAAAQGVAVRAATEALNAAVTEELVTGSDMSHVLVIDDQDAEGVRVAHFDFTRVARVQAEATQRAEEHLRDLSAQTLRLPAAQAIGGVLLTNLGVTLPVRVNMIGSVHSSVAAEVRSVGVNQTVHTLNLDLTADVQAVTPLVMAPAHVRTRVLLAYVVLNGEVPGTYFGGPGAGGVVLPTPAR